jgi:hypothetical protein
MPALSEVAAAVLTQSNSATDPIETQLDDNTASIANIQDGGVTATATCSREPVNGNTAPHRHDHKTATCTTVGPEDVL